MFSNMEEIPLELWEQIFVSLPTIKDYIALLLVCKRFKEIIAQGVHTINDTHSMLLTCNLGDMFPRLQKCYLYYSRISSETMTSLLAIPTLKIINFQIDHHTFKKIWLPYWMDPKRTQSDFDSVCHDLTIHHRLNCECGRSTTYTSFNNGILYTESSCRKILNVLKTLTGKFLVKDRWEYSVSMISKHIYPNNIGLVQDSLRSNLGILDIIGVRDNITYIGFDNINHYQLWTMRARTLNRYITKDTIFYNEVIIDIPVPLQFVETIHYIFPNMKQIRIISTGVLPEISGVKVMGYNPILNQCF